MRHTAKEKLDCKEKGGRVAMKGSRTTVQAAYGDRDAPEIVEHAVEGAVEYTGFHGPPD